MSNIDKIRQEIERLYNGEAPKHDQQCEFEDGYFTGLATISNFIDSLSEEPDKSLEEAAEESLEEQDVAELFCGSYEAWQMLEMFKAGAEWMAKQGYSLEYVIKYAWGVSDTSTESKKATLSFPLPAYIFEGDHVIIQIRKK